MSLRLKEITWRSPMFLRQQKPANAKHLPSYLEGLPVFRSQWWINLKTLIVPIFTFNHSVCLSWLHNFLVEYVSKNMYFTESLRSKCFGSWKLRSLLLINPIVIGVRGVYTSNQQHITYRTLIDRFGLQPQPWLWLCGLL